MKHNKTKIAAIGLVVLASAILPSAGVFAATQSVNTTINGTVQATISVSVSAGTVAMNVTPTSGARTSSSSHNVLVSSNNTAGYRLTLQMISADRRLEFSSNFIDPSAGTLASPAATLATNTWGYRVDDLGTFGTGTTVETNAVTSAFKWAGVPASGSPDQIKTTATTASSDSTTVWYAMSADSSKPNGDYTDQVVYTATTN